MKFRILEQFPRMTILHHMDSEQRVWGTSHRWINVRDGEKWMRFAQFPFHVPRDLLDFSRPTARAFRADKCNVYVNRMGKVLGIRAGRVYRIIQNKKPQPLFKINGDCVLHGSISEDENGNIFFGEYFMKPGREASSHLASWLPNWMQEYCLRVRYSIRLWHWVFFVIRTMRDALLIHRARAFIWTASLWWNWNIMDGMLFSPSYNLKQEDTGHWSCSSGGR